MRYGSVEYDVTTVLAAFQQHRTLQIAPVKEWIREIYMKTFSKRVSQKLEQNQLRFTQCSKLADPR